MFNVWEMRECHFRKPIC